MLIQMQDDGETLISVLGGRVGEYTTQDLQRIQEDFKQVTDTQNISYISIADQNLNIIVSEEFKI